MTFDADILLWINGHYAKWADTLMWWTSMVVTWLPLYVLLLGLVVWKYRNWRAVLLITIGFVVAVGLSDFICSGILKPLFCRLRPTREPALDPLHLVNKYIGDPYGFCSSHAANTMACATLFCLLYRHKIATALLMLWVALNCYSRMYLGAHYPTDIIAGLAVGALLAALVYWALSRWLPEGDEAARQGGS